MKDLTIQDVDKICDQLMKMQLSNSNAELITRAYTAHEALRELQPFLKYKTKE